MAGTWRLAPPEFARALDGEGSRLVGGRWNSPGRAVVYTSSHLSLSVLEVFVNIPPVARDRLPDFEAVQIHVPDDAGTAEVRYGQFNELMNSRDPPAACRSVGDEWISRGTELLLRAPSVVVPEELNVMINPAHPCMREVRMLSARRFRFDPRLVASRT